MHNATTTVGTARVELMSFVDAANAMYAAEQKLSQERSTYRLFCSELSSSTDAEVAAQGRIVAKAERSCRIASAAFMAARALLHTAKAA